MARHGFKVLFAASLLFLVLGCENKMEGLNFSPYEGSQNPNFGDLIPASQIARKLDQVKPRTEWIRTFGITDGLEAIPSQAKSRGLFTAIGAWLDSNPATCQQQMNNLIAAAQAGNVDIAVVGNEVLLRNEMTTSQLISYINQFRAAVPNVPVTTAEVYGKLHDHPAVIAACDLVVANFYPFWEGIPVEYAIWKLNYDYGELKAICGPKPVYIGETGWPSDGNPIGEAVPNLENAVFYLLNFLSWAEAKGLHYFYFEAMDEAWKGLYEGPHGDDWGLMYEDGTLKPGMLDAFLGKRIPDNWSGTVPGGEGEPEIYYTYLPPIGSHDNLEGQIWHADTGNHYAAVYILVYGQWWIKPYSASPLTPLRPNGSFICDITTGGYDAYATRVAAFLVPAGYSPPILLGASNLPSELYVNSLAWVIEDR